MSPKFFLTTTIFFFFAIAPVYAAPLEYLRAQQLDHPHCRGRAKLDVARDYLTEIANDIEGVQDFNELVRHYRRKRWPKFTQKLGNFRQDFPKSPLQEPADFYELQALLEQAEEDVGPPNIKLIEHKFQALLLKHPKSELTPVIYTTMGNFWLQRDMFSRSLAIYEKAREEFPFHSSKCVVLQGVAESRYLLNEIARAKPTFELVLQKCKNPQIRLGAMVRLADINWTLHPRKSEKGYVRALKKDLNRFNRFYPHALYNLAELLYRKKKLGRAKFYFDEYLKHTPRQAQCVPYALKRMADIAFKKKEKIKKVVGLYMVARDRAPGSDIGRFSYVRGLLLELPKVVKPENKRRIKVVDEQLDKVTNARIRKQGYIDKGLALLDSGEPHAYEFLRKLNERGVFKYQRKAEKEFIRNKTIWYLDQDIRKVRASKDSYLNAEEENFVLKQIEKVYSKWIHGSRQAKKTRAWFTTAVLERFRKSLKVDRDGAIKELKQWSLSQLWDPNAASSGMRNAVAKDLMAHLWENPEPDKASLAYMQNKKLFEPLVRGPYGMLWLAVAEELQDKKKIRRLTNKMSVMRTPASIQKSLPRSVRDFSFLVAGRAYRLVGKNTKAEDSFLRVRTQPFLSQALSELATLYVDSRRFGEAYKVGLKRYKADGNEKRLSRLKELLYYIEKGGLGRRISSLVRLVDENNFNGKAKAPFYHSAGKSYFKRSQCKQASRMFERVLVSDKDFSNRAEAQYKLGKCLLSLRKPAQAKRVWEELAKVEDNFWAPLARNELNILSQ